MPATIELSNPYPGLSADRLWFLCTDFNALAEVCRGMVSFEGLPSGQCTEGQRIAVEVRIFGILPRQTYHMHVVSLDNEARMFLSHEHGAGVKTWVHRVWVEATPEGATLHDRVELDAGWLTPIFAAYARILYNHRHRRRLKLLAAEPETP